MRFARNSMNRTNDGLLKITRILFSDVFLGGISIQFRL